MKPNHIVFLALALATVLLLVGSLITGLIIGRTMANPPARIPMPATFTTPQPSNNLARDLANVLLPDIRCEVPINHWTLAKFRDNQGKEHALFVYNVLDPYENWVVMTEYRDPNVYNMKDFLDPSVELENPIPLAGMSVWAQNDNLVMIKCPPITECRTEPIDRK